MRTKFLPLVFLLVVVHQSCAQNPLEDPKGVIRDRETATRIGELILISVYGEDKVRHGRPYQAESDDERWYISANLPSKNSDTVNMFGGGFYITLSRKDGRVLQIGLDE